MSFIPAEILDQTIESRTFQVRQRVVNSVSLRFKSLGFPEHGAPDISVKVVHLARELPVIGPTLAEDYHHDSTPL